MGSDSERLREIAARHADHPDGTESAEGNFLRAVAARLGTLEEALGFYALEDNYTFPSCADDAGSPAEQDSGKRAREALGEDWCG